MLTKYVVAFNRDRDSYEVPLALHEAGCLERLVTDIYAPDSLSGLSLARWLRLSHRRREGLPSEFVDWSWPALWRQTFGLWKARDESARLAEFKALDQQLSRQALKVARRTDSSLLLYSGYALEAFSEPDSIQRPKVLFVFHPHATLTGEILQRDFESHPEMIWSHALHLEEMRASDANRLGAEISLADELICASSFTAESVRRAGNDKHVAVVPYGCSFGAVSSARPSIGGRRVRVLFVGQGMQRKGLHHLLKVWKKGAISGAELTVVAGRLDPAAGRMAEADGQQVRMLPALPREQLAAEFASADVFVMPSLVEGFGLVYLEALAAGCHVIGTPNTGLPDLQAPPWAVSIVPAGDLDGLEAALTGAISLVKSPGYSAEMVRQFAETRTWTGFRLSLRRALGLPEIGGAVPS